MLHNNRQAGFTLIELIIVIVILGVLAVSAAPKFLSFNTDAEQANFDSFVGAFRTGTKIYQASWLAKGQPSTAFSGVNSHPSEDGFPAGGSNTATATEGDCHLIWQDVLADVTTPVFISGSGGWSSSVAEVDWASSASQLSQFGETSDTFCHYVYVRSYYNGAFSGLNGERIPTIQYNISTGEIAVFGWPYNP